MADLDAKLKTISFSLLPIPRLSSTSDEAEP